MISAYLLSGEITVRDMLYGINCVVTVINFILLFLHFYAID